MSTTPPTRVNRLASSFSTATSPKTAGAFTCLAGDILVCKAINEGSAAFGTSPTGGSGLTWTQQMSLTNDANSAGVEIWTTTVPSNQSVTVSLTQAGGTQLYGIEVVQYRDSAGIGQVWSGRITTGSGAPSVTATATGDDSAIEMAVTDWAAIATTGKTYRTTNAGTFTETAAVNVSGRYTYYLGAHADSGAAGSKQIGLSAPSTMRWTVGAVEILGLSSGGVTVKQLAQLGVG